MLQWDFIRQYGLRAMEELSRQPRMSQEEFIEQFERLNQTERPILAKMGYFD